MRRILFSLMVIASVVALLSGGTLAYFSDTVESVDNTLGAGTLNLHIADNNEGWYDTQPVTASITSPAGWAPGEQFDADPIRIKNVGSIDAKYLAIDWHDLQGEHELARHIQVVTFKECIPMADGSCLWIDNLGPEQRYHALVGDAQSPLTLRELMESYVVGWPEGTNQPCNTAPYVKVDEFGKCVKATTDGLTGYGYDTVPEGTPAIRAGGEYQMVLGFKLLPETPNAMQGKSLSFDISFMAVQDTSQVP